MPGNNWICDVVHARNMLQKMQLQRVNRIGELTMGMLTQNAKGRENLPFRLDWICLAGDRSRLASSIRTANAPIFFEHAHEVGHSSQSVSISAVYLCNNLWSDFKMQRLHNETAITLSD